MQPISNLHLKNTTLLQRNTTTLRKTNIALGVPKRRRRAATTLFRLLMGRHPVTAAKRRRRHGRCFSSQPPLLTLTRTQIRNKPCDLGRCRLGSLPTKARRPPALQPCPRGCRVASKHVGSTALFLRHRGQPLHTAARRDLVCQLTSKPTLHFPHLPPP